MALHSKEPDAAQAPLPPLRSKEPDATRTPPPPPPRRSAASRALGTAELIERILVAFAQPEIKIAVLEPCVQLFPLLRVSKTWRHTIAHSRALGPLMCESSRLSTAWQQRTANALSRRDDRSMLHRPLAMVLYDSGPKINAAWIRTRRRGDGQTGSWAHIRLLRSDEPAHDRIAFSWPVGSAGFVVVRHTPHMTLGQLFDRVEAIRAGRAPPTYWFPPHDA